MAVERKGEEREQRVKYRAERGEDQSREEEGECKKRIQVKARRGWIADGIFVSMKCKYEHCVCMCMRRDFHAFLLLLMLLCLSMRNML